MEIADLYHGRSLQHSLPCLRTLGDQPIVLEPERGSLE
jgi:hypothetical protein